MRIALAIGLLALTTGIAHAQWGAEIPLTNTGSDNFGEGLATSDSTVHVIYGGGVRYRKSVDNGVTFGNEKTLDGAGNIHLTDPLVADGSDVWAIYLKNQKNVMDWCCPRDVGDIYLIHSGDAGETWDTPKRLTTAQGAFRVSIAYSANRVHIVWMDYRANAWDVYYLRSNDRGATWDPEKRIAQSAGTFGAERPQLAARGDGVFVTIWDDRGTNPTCMAGPTFTFTTCPDTFYIGSLDGGTTWSTETAVSYSGAAIAGRNDIATSGTSSLVINFNRSAENTADANPHLFAVHSPDNGATWETAQQLTNTAGSSDHGSIIGDRRSVFLAWHDSRNGTLEIYYTHSTSEGTSWIPDELVSTSNAEGSTPLIAVTDQFVHVTWLDKRTGTYQMMYRHRDRPSEPAADDAGPNAGDAGTTVGSADTGCCWSGKRVPSLFPLVAFVWITARRRRRP